MDEIKPRSSYIDIVKGLLILVVIFHHIMFAAKEMNVDGSFSWNLHLLPLYASWFMPAFFFITGYCSNFNKDFKHFLTNNVSTVLWPALTSFLITALYDMLLFKGTETLVEACSTIPIRGFNWFLMALFLSKMIYWVIKRTVKNEKIMGGAIVLLSCIAIIFNDTNLFGENWFHHRHALYLTISLYLGNLAKEKNLLQKKYLMIMSLIFIVTVLTCMKLNGVTPGIAGLWINFNIWEVPLHILLAITGTSVALLVAMIISKCKILEQIGKDSLIYYIFHIEVIRTVLPLICTYLITPISAISICLVDTITVFCTVVICWIISYVIGNSHLYKLIRF